MKPQGFNLYYRSGLVMILTVVSAILSGVANATPDDAAGASLQETKSRVKKNIDFDWYFHLGDVPGGQSEGVSYTSWRKLDVPHDWSIEGEYKEKAPGGGRVGFLPTGTGWYKKEIEWEDAWKDKLVFIEFGGIFMNSTVWLNGQEVGFRPMGYLNLGYELTPYLKQGKNILTVKVDNNLQPAARWYTGSGIYRHVDLIVTDKIHVARHGTYVRTSEVSSRSSVVEVDAEIENKTGNDVSVTVISVITDSDGKEVIRKNKQVRLLAHSFIPQLVNEKLTIDNPSLWSPETPVVYYLNTIIEKDGRETDFYTTRFGVRKLEYDTIAGFKLNGVARKMKGVCIHQDAAPAGAAVNEDILHRRLVILKEMGCDAIRTTHHPFADEFYAMCDTMGFMVMDEPWDGWYLWENHGKAEYDYGYYFLDWWEKDLQDFIRRDRNYPCNVMWSAGNEVWGWDKHLYLQWKIVDTYHKMDPPRPVTQAWALGKYIDIAGFNANGENQGDIADFHKKQPGKLAVGTEIPHTRQTRGVYRTMSSYNPWTQSDISENDLARLFPIPNLSEKEVFEGVDPRYASGYDNQTRRISVRDQWKQTRDNDFFIGEFRWTGIDYLGESWGWPARTNNYGIIDLAGFPKDSYYLYQSFWLDKPMVHLLPHWTHPGKEGVAIPVVAYTNGVAAELFLNGKSLGKKTMDPGILQIVWQVPYKPGTLTVVAYDKNGKKIAGKSVSTASAPAGITLTADRTVIKANRRDIIHVVADVTDSKGRFVPIADNNIEFEVTGPYKLIGTENGDILDITPAKTSARKAFMGKVLLMLQATDEPGTLVITAKSPGLKSSKVTAKSL